MKEILILTDDFSAYSKYRSLLENGDVDISLRASTREALSFTRTRNVNLIIVDLDIPKFRVKHVNLIRKLSKRANVINIVNDIASRALEECVTLEVEVMVKPFKNSSLKNIVNELLDTTDDNIKENIDSCILDSPFCDAENYAMEE